MMMENWRAKKEQRLAVIVPAGPTDGREVLKLWLARPMRTKKANICGIEAYLSPYELLVPFTSDVWGRVSE